MTQQTMFLIFLGAALIVVSLMDYFATQKNRATGGKEGGLFKSKGGQQFATLACIAMAFILPWAGMTGQTYGQGPAAIIVLFVGVVGKFMGWRSNIEAMKHRSRR